MSAAQAGDLEAVQLLCVFGVNPHIVDRVCMHVPPTHIATVDINGLYTQVGATAAAIASAHQHTALHSQLVEYMEQREAVGPAPPPTEQQPPPPPTTGQPPAEPGPTTEQQQQQQQPPPPPTTGQPPAEPGPTTEQQQQQQQPAEDTGQQPPQSSPSTEDTDKVTEVDHVLTSCAHLPTHYLLGCRGNHRN